MGGMIPFDFVEGKLRLGDESKYKLNYLLIFNLFVNKEKRGLIAKNSLLNNLTYL